MMTRMLIDATHPEETRMVVVNGNRLEDFDHETTNKTRLKGNIYLAKVTRVEPSLQAAFVDYGGNRHGFLAFSEIHPDYYRIPISDREEILQEEATASAEDDEYIDPGIDDDGKSEVVPVETLDHETSGNEAADDEIGDTNPKSEALNANEMADEEQTSPDDSAAEGEETAEARTTSEDSDASPDDDTKRDQPDPRTSSADPRRRRGRSRRDIATQAEASIDTVGGDDMEEINERRRSPVRRYRIQEVISRRQIILVQVTKEERGNKGAAITSYISLAGRYCVLMPNTPRGGGISRKISNIQDRKRLKKILDEFEIPEGMAVIVRTAGAQRTKAEIRRDYEYLLKLWDEFREKTLRSIAPALIHEEANLIKRSIRDLYNKDIDEVLIEGEEGYRTGKDFMKLLMPSHAKRVKQYKEPKIPLFQRYQVEAQIDDIHSPVVQLKSGGYIVLNSTEALVAIDVNSGRATRERNIEETALKTNLEAADEIARQLKLRDLAGLIVIDFIDMEDSRNRHAVERRLKNAMANDRAQSQIGRISAFGLLEMSRQRLRPSVIEASMSTCPTCGGTGFIRSTESTALTVLRAIEEEGIRQRATEISVHVPPRVAFYILNQKRPDLTTIEKRYDFRVLIEIDASLVPPDHRIEKTVTQPELENEDEGSHAAGESSSRRRRGGLTRRSEDETDEKETRVEAKNDDTDEDSEASAEAQGKKKENGGRRRRGRRGGRRRRGNGSADTITSTGDELTAENSDGAVPATENVDIETAVEAGEFQKKSQTRSRKGRHRSRRVDEAAAEDTSPEETVAATADTPGANSDPADGEKPAKPTRRRRSRKQTDEAGTEDKTKAVMETVATEPAAAEEKAASPASDGANGSPTPQAKASDDDGDASNDNATATQPPPKKRRGWWSIAR
ncbi:MAG: ribonuclease E/G [Rhodospirillaceae bacterium]|nr:ribonuclease E/G [Rhodospirillaceae bacterium]